MSSLAYWFLIMLRWPDSLMWLSKNEPICEGKWMLLTIGCSALVLSHRQTGKSNHMLRFFTNSRAGDVLWAVDQFCWALPVSSFFSEKCKTSLLCFSFTGPHVLVCPLLQRRLGEHHVWWSGCCGYWPTGNVLQSLEVLLSVIPYLISVWSPREEQSYGAYLRSWLPTRLPSVSILDWVAFTVAAPLVVHSYWWGFYSK